MKIVNFCNITFHLLLLLSARGMYAQSCYVTRAGNTFAIGNGSFRFIGVNLGATHLFDKPDGSTTYTTNQEIQHQITQANAMGAKVIRVFSCEKELTHVQNGDRLQNLINIMNNVNSEMRIIVVLTNSYNNGGHFPAGDEPYHNSGPHNIYNNTWYDGDYNLHFKPWVQYITYRFRSEKKIFAWEIGNEMQASTSSRMLNFAYDIGYTIKNQGANQMISTGFIGINHACNGGVSNGLISQMYIGPYSTWGASPFEFGSVHVYNNEQVGSTPNSCNKDNPQHHQIDIDWFLSNNFPYIVGEAGFSGAGGSNGHFAGCTWNGVAIPSTQSNRKPATEATCNTFFSTYSCDGYMQWGFRAPNGPGVNAHGDNDVGMDANPHSDYNDLYSYYASKSASLPAGGSCNSLPICDDFNYMYNMTLPAGEKHYYAAQKIKLTLVTIPSNSITHLHAPQISLENCTIGGNGKQLHTYNDPCTYGQHWPQMRFIDNINLSTKESNDGVLMYPNPFKDLLSLRLLDESIQPPFELQIYNTVGQQVLSTFIQELDANNAITVSTPGLTQGAYFVVLKRNSAAFYKGKIYKSN